MSSIIFPKCSRLVLLGGGPLIIKLIDRYGPLGLDVVCITSPRQSEVFVEQEMLFKDALHKSGIRYLITESISDDAVRDFLENNSNSLCISLGAAWIFRKNIVDALFHSRLLNLHGTRLPEDRGGGGFSWQVLSKNHFGNCALHIVDSGIDTGPIIAHKEFLYPATCRIPRDYIQVYQQQNMEFLCEFIDGLLQEQKTVNFLSQPEYLSTYWPRLATNVNGWINWDWASSEIERFICAFDKPHPGAKTTLNGEVVSLMDVMLTHQDASRHPFQSGLVYRVGSSWICVASRNGSLIVQTVNNEKGENIVDRIRIGDRFFTSITELENAKNRVHYGPRGLR